MNKKKRQIITQTEIDIFKWDNRFLLKGHNVKYVENYIFCNHF